MHEIRNSPAIPPELRFSSTNPSIYGVHQCSSLVSNPDNCSWTRLPFVLYFCTVCENLLRFLKINILRKYTNDFQYPLLELQKMLTCINHENVFSISHSQNFHFIDIVIIVSSALQIPWDSNHNQMGIYRISSKLSRFFARSLYHWNVHGFTRVIGCQDQIMGCRRSLSEPMRQ